MNKSVKNMGKLIVLKSIKHVSLLLRRNYFFFLITTIDKFDGFFFFNCSATYDCDIYKLR